MRSHRNLNSLLLFLALAMVLTLWGRRVAWADPASLRACFVSVTQACNTQSDNPAICIHDGQTACEAEAGPSPPDVTRAMTDWSSPPINSARAVVLGFILGLIKGQTNLP